MENRTDWKGLFRDGGRFNKAVRAQQEELGELATETEFRNMRCALAVSFLLTGLGFAAHVLQYQEQWVKESPLLNVAGGGAFLLGACLLWLCGVGWWCITNSHELRLYAEMHLLWGVQPYRSALGILTVFVLLAVMSRLLLPRSRNRQDFSIWLCMLTMAVLWGALGGVFLGFCISGVAPHGSTGDFPA